jgi:hypothetical protein
VTWLAFAQQKNTYWDIVYGVLSCMPYSTRRVELRINSQSWVVFGLLAFQKLAAQALCGTSLVWFHTNYRAACALVSRACVPAH